MIAASQAVWWYASRASGLVLWLVLAATVAWGLAVSSKLVRRRGLPAWMLGLHQHLATLAIVFTAAHLGSLWADSYVHFGPRQLFVPMASSWRPGAVAWGIGAFYLLLIVQVSTWAMKRLPRRLWHALHLASLPLLVAGTAHGILAGADWSNRVVEWALLLLASAVVALGTFRMVVPAKDPATVDRLAAARAAAAARTGAPPSPTASSSTHP